jgi:hypothetical protein
MKSEEEEERSFSLFTFGSINYTLFHCFISTSMCILVRSHVLAAR